MSRLVLTGWVMHPKSHRMAEGSNRVGASKRARKPLKINLERRAEIGQQKRARTRRSLLDAAFDLLGREHGRNTRIEEICAGAGVARATFYNYFSSMDDLFAALSEDLSHDFNRSVHALLDTMPTASQRSVAAVRYYLQKALDDPKWGWAMVNISAGGPIFGQDTHDLAEKTTQQGIEAGEFDVGPNTGRDIQLGATHAAMITQLRNPPSGGYPASVARHILMGLGVAKARADEIAGEALPPLPRT